MDPDPNSGEKMDPDPHSGKKMDPDPHSGKKMDPDPHSGKKLDPDPTQHRFSVLPTRWLRRSFRRRSSPLGPPSSPRRRRPQRPSLIRPRPRTPKARSIRRPRDGRAPAVREFNLWMMTSMDEGRRGRGGGRAGG